MEGAGVALLSCRAGQPYGRGARDLCLSDSFVIFGAAVRPDGTPSGSLRRRVEGALRLGEGVTDRLFLATGGVGRHGPAEALVIRDLLLAAGVAPHEILVEDKARDTLESVLFCHAILRRRPEVETVWPCSSDYHNPRCALLFRMLGYRVRRGRMPPDRPHLGVAKWGRYLLKEVIATPYDVVQLALRTGLGFARHRIE